MKLHPLFIIFALLASPAYGGACNGLFGIAGPIASISVLLFGNYDASQNTDTAANGTITVGCTIPVINTLPSFTLGLSTGGGSFSQRKMFLLTQPLNYNIYTNAALNTVLGDGSGSTQTLSYTAGGAGGDSDTKAFTVFGNIPKHQYIPVGLYLDAITITITY